MIKCPNCGNEVKVIFNGREIINKCLKCDYEVVTTYNSQIDLDNIKLISKLTGDNFIQSKKYLESGYSFKKEYAEGILEKKKIFDEYKIKYQIVPKFPY